MAARAIGRAAELLTLTRAERGDLVERTIEVQAALDEAAFLVANTTPEVDCLLDVQRLENRLEAELAHALGTARSEARIVAGQLEAITP